MTYESELGADIIVLWISVTADVFCRGFDCDFLLVAGEPLLEAGALEVLLAMFEQEFILLKGVDIISQKAVKHIPNRVPLAIFE